MFRESAYNSIPTADTRPKPAPLPKPAPRPEPVGKPKPSSLLTNTKEENAMLFHEGMVAPEKLFQILGPAKAEEVMQLSSKIEEEYIPQTPKVREIPHPLLGDIVTALKNYWRPDKTEEDEDKLYEIANNLINSDSRFRELMLQYEPLIAIDADGTEKYLSKALKDFIELNPKITEE
jgi:hypothetical protein